MEYTGFLAPDGYDRAVTRGDGLIRSGRQIDPLRIGDPDIALDVVLD